MSANVSGTILVGSRLNPNDAYYTEQFFPRLKKNLSSEELNPSIYRPTEQAARYLQYHYMG